MVLDVGTGADKEKVEYRIWSPFRSKIASAISRGIKETGITPGTKLLYLGAASGTTVSHCSDVVGPEGVVYAVEFAPRPARDLINMAKKRPNIVPIMADARRPEHYRMLVGLVDTIFADVAQPNQAAIVGLNAQYFLKNDGRVFVAVKASCIDSTAKPEVVFDQEVDRLREYGIKPRAMVSLEPFEKDHCVVLGKYRKSK